MKALVSQLPARPMQPPASNCLPHTSHLELPQRNWRLQKRNQGLVRSTACAARTEPTGPVLRAPWPPAPSAASAPGAAAGERTCPGRLFLPLLFPPPISILPRDRQAALPSHLAAVVPDSSPPSFYPPFPRSAHRGTTVGRVPFPVDRSPEGSRPHKAYNTARVTGRRPAEVGPLVPGGISH